MYHFLSFMSCGDKGYPLGPHCDVNADHLVKVVSDFSTVQLQFFLLQLISTPCEDCQQYMGTIYVPEPIRPLQKRSNHKLAK
jgi:hypothetical protein